MRILFLILFFSTLNCVAQSLDEASRSLASSSEVRDGRFSFYAIDLSNGRPLVSHDIDRKMSPASTMKLFTTYAALDILGPDHRFVTKVGYQGAIDQEGNLQGDLVIIAGGDPVLDSEQFQKSYGDGSSFALQILKALKDKGVKQIKGEILIDESFYEGIDVPDEWTWQDMGNYYGAGAHAFTFAENKFNLYFKSSSKPGSQTTLTRSDAVLESTSPINLVKSASIHTDQAYVYSSPKSNHMTVHGEIPLNKTDFKVKAAIPHPALEFKARLTNTLNEAGVIYKNVEKDQRSKENNIGSQNITEILIMNSPRLIEITAYTNMKSNNLFAEHLLRQIGKVRKGEGSYTAGIKAVEAWCQSKNISTKGLRIKDGSGLSRANLVSARSMVDLLSKLNTEDYSTEFMKALPCAGESGSMRRVGAGTTVAGRMYAKTGYIEGVRAYAGYLEKTDGGRIAFCIMANDYDMSASEMRKKLTRLLVKLGQTTVPVKAKSTN